MSWRPAFVQPLEPPIATALILRVIVLQRAAREANNESAEVVDIIKPGRRIKIKGHRQ